MTEDRIERPELREYRLAARDWLVRNVASVVGTPDDDSPSPERVEYLKRTQAKLYEAGYAGFAFPVEYGGQGLSTEYERVFSEEARGYDVPFRFFGVSIGILGATLAACGSHEQKLRHIPKILSGEERWLQF